MLELVVYTLAAIIIYTASDALLRHIERRRGERLANRSVVFFIIILTLAIVTFAAFRAFLQ
jgi:predicted PurR-regulated permease PerM